MTASIGSGGVTFPDGSVLSGLYPSNGNSLGYDGYQKFPSGIIYQWGTWNGALTTSGNGGSASFTTPIKFPNAPLQVVVVPGYTEYIPGLFVSDDAVILSVGWSQQTETTTISVSVDGLGSSPSVQKLRWFAVGY
jgi:hypothetical protein